MNEKYLILTTCYPISVLANAIPPSTGITSPSDQIILNQTSNFTADFNIPQDKLSFQFSVWLIVLLSLTSLFAIWFILCGLFRRADAYRTPGMEVPGYGFGDGYGLGFGGGGLNSMTGTGGGGGLFSGLSFDPDV